MNVNNYNPKFQETTEDTLSMIKQFAINTVLNITKQDNSPILNKSATVEDIDTKVKLIKDIVDFELKTKYGV